MPSHEAVPRGMSWFASWRFAIFTLSLLFSFTALSGIVLLLPSGDSALGNFADAYRMWCFGYDPATNKYQITWIVLLFVDPLMLALVVIAVWWGELKRGFAVERPAVIRVAAMGTTAVLLASSGFLFMDVPRYTGPLPFPGEELRTSYNTPSFELQDHHGNQVALEDFSDKIIILTSIYSCCPTACPLILQQAQRVISGLSEEERNEVVVLAISMDPERDTPEALARMAEAHRVDPEIFHLLTGPPDIIFTTLNRLGIERRVNEETGIIDHPNLFILVDRQGLIAYRFAMGEQQEAWLSTALRMLIAEPKPAT